MRAATVVLVLCLAAAPSVAAQGTGPAPDLDRVYAAFTEAYRKADASLVSELYGRDAFYLQPDADVLQGRPAIHAIFERFLGPIAARGAQGPAIYFEILDRQVQGGIGWDIGYFRMGPPGADSASAERAGKFIVLWRREADGRWRIHADGYSGVARRTTP